MSTAATGIAGAPVRRVAVGGGGERRRVTLEERLRATWRAAHAEGVADCPLCGSRMTWRDDAAECGSCGTRLS